MAADVVVPDTPAPDAAAASPWWTHGFVEVGGRGFLNNPPYGGHIYQGNTGSLAKYYEYSSIKPGPFSDFFVAAGSKDGLYKVDAYGQNVGYSDQRYLADFSKAGEHYVDFMWDQTPHVYSTSALTLFNRSGNALTLANPNVGNQLFGAVGPAWAETAANAAKVAPIISNSVSPTDVGIRRDTAAVEYRFTPTDNWDIRANYSHMRRTGTQVDGVLFTPTNDGARVDVAKPVDDTTHNFGVSGEYSGTSFWGQKFNAMVGYNGSVYHDDFDAYTVQNPFCNSTGVSCAQGSQPLAQMSTPPSNQMNGVSGTFGADLPFKSRYMGTVAYTGMRQNDQFLPFAINPVSLNSGAPANALSSLPAQSLNGAINTLLFNNVVTTQVTSDLKTKVSYRYYSYDNATPELNIPDWIITDAASPLTLGHVNYAPVNTLSISYIKQNAAAEATWRPLTTVNLGAAYGYERYDWTRADASSTNENSGKVYADWKPVRWLTARASGEFGERRASNYDYLGNVGLFQWPVSVVTASIPSGHPNSTNYSPYYRQLYLDDRNRAQGKFSVAIDLTRSLTITPTLNLKSDDYQFAANQEGLTHDHSRAAGVEMAYVVNPDTTLLFSYMNENRKQQILSAFGTQIAPYSIAQQTYNGWTQLTYANITDRVNTYIAAVNFAIIPQKFDLRLSATLSVGNDTQPLYFFNNTGPTTGGQYPEVKDTFSRLEALAKYKLDQDFVRSLGATGDITLKLRYAYERNNTTNWNNDTMQAYMYSVLAQKQVVYYQALAGNNPNYQVHLLGGSVAWAW
jgi:MtrB/PioB family decaheme-associated outer membrane protein